MSPPLVEQTSNPVQSRWDHYMCVFSPLFCLAAAPAITPTSGKILDLSAQKGSTNGCRLITSGPAWN